MRWLSPAGIGLLSVFVLPVPFTSHAYSEWPAISLKMSTITEQRGCRLDCDLKSMKGDIRFRQNAFGSMESLCKFMNAMMALGNYLHENTNAGKTYTIFVHFDDRVRSITVSDLLALSRKYPGAIDVNGLWEFFANLRPE